MAIRLPKLTEKAFMAQVIKLATLRGWKVYHVHDSRFSAKGFPDLVMARGNRMIAAELKTGKYKTTPEQDDWLLVLGSVPGVYATVWRPENWDEIERRLA